MAARLGGIIVLAILIVAGAVAVDAAMHDAGTHEAVTNETFTPPASGGVVTLAQSNQNDVTYDYQDDIEVTNNSTGGEIDDDGNWSWNRNNGTLTVVDNSHLSNQSGANVSYGYVEQGETAAGLGALFAGGLEVAQLMLIVLAAAFVLTALGVFKGGV